MDRKNPQTAMSSFVSKRKRRQRGPDPEAEAPGTSSKLDNSPKATFPRLGTHEGLESASLQLPPGMKQLKVLMKEVFQKQEVDLSPSVCLYSAASERYVVTYGKLRCLARFSMDALKSQLYCSWPVQ